MEDRGSFGCIIGINYQWKAVQVISYPKGTVWISLMHVRKLRSHGMAREHGHVFDAERLEDVLDEIVIETLAGGAFKCDTGPVNTDLSM